MKRRRKRRNSKISKAQIAIYEHLISIYSLTIILNDTRTIKPLHLDIYIPELRIGIEYDGDYWHYSDWAIKRGSLTRMLYKNKVCVEKNIKLIRIKESDWKNNFEAEYQKLIDFIENCLEDDE